MRPSPDPFTEALLARADDALVLGHRLSEWCGHAPTPEEDLALANLALDQIGLARALYAEAGAGSGRTEDELAYFRTDRDFRNCLLVEQPNGDFAHTIVRQFLYTAYADPFWRAAAGSADPALAAIAAKAELESAYHLRHASEWLIRLGDGTAESHARAQTALDALWPCTAELFEPEPEARLPDPVPLRAAWSATVDRVLARATLARPADGWAQTGGRRGRHTEVFGKMLAEMQSLARAHPGAVW
jgi:ring-1,2-phenylacetyl-CoA epoxidase subunit PaaC